MNTATTLHEDVDEMLSTVAHELSTPIAVVRGYLTLLEDDGDDEALRRKAVAAIGRNLDLVDRLVLRLRDLHQLQIGRLDLDRHEIDLGVFTQEVVADIRDSVLSRTPTRVDVEGEPVIVRGDRARLRQVLFNLLNNAAEYSSDGSEVVITVRRDRATADVIVRDHGLGIAPEDAERIFEKFTRGTDAGGGTGLGLYISRELARAHGGELIAEPAEGQGSLFILRLPAG